MPAAGQLIIEAKEFEAPYSYEAKTTYLSTVNLYEYIKIFLR